VTACPTCGHDPDETPRRAGPTEAETRARLLAEEEIERDADRNARGLRTSRAALRRNAGLADTQ
jgi:hypothetical protein